MDIVANVLNSIKMANLRGHETVTVSNSKFILSIIECLKRAGYVSDFEIKTVKTRNYIEIKLIYKKGNAPKIETVQRISKPSRRMYISVKELRSVRNGYGSAIISTPKGVMTEKEAKKEMVGGEMLFKIW